MRAFATAVALAAVLSIAWRIYDIGTRIEWLIDWVSIEEPPMPSQLHFKKPLDGGGTVELTVTQMTGESIADFAARARAEWAAVCKELGG